MIFRNYPVLHPWHSADLGENPPEYLNAIIEVPKESKVKYELDKRSGFIKVDRILYGPYVYPANYGFIPQTYCEDGDPLDIMVYCQEAIFPRTIAPARVIGGLKMFDQGESDDKIFAVMEGDPAYKEIKDISEMPPYMLRELREFFTNYKNLENKEVEVIDFYGREKAFQAVNDAFELYRKHADELQKKDSA